LTLESNLTGSIDRPVGLGKAGTTTLPITEISITGIPSIISMYGKSRRQPAAARAKIDVCSGLLIHVVQIAYSLSKWIMLGISDKNKPG
jgi:hypothetical protein